MVGLLAAHHPQGVVLEDPVVSVVGDDDGEIHVVSHGRVDRLRVVEIRAVADERDDVARIGAFTLGNSRSDRRREAVAEPATFVTDPPLGAERNVPSHRLPRRDPLVDNERVRCRLGHRGPQLTLGGAGVVRIWCRGTTGLVERRDALAGVCEPSRPLVVRERL